MMQLFKHQSTASVQQKHRHTRHAVIPRVSFISNLFKPDQRQPKEVKTILEKIEGSNGGLLTSPAEKAEITGLIDQLAEENQGLETTGPKLSATWRLLWGTEKETQFICKNAGIFGTQAGDIYQVIDLDSSLLQNVITFPPSGAFVVNSTITVEGEQRTAFKFNSAILKRAEGDTRVPPFGQGWFDTIYIDDDVRIARDIRGDYLVVARDGPPRLF